MDIQVGAQRIQLDDVGQGSPVLLLHSSGMSSLQWRRLKEKLAQTHRVLAPDLIGYGGSAPWAGEGTFDFRHDLDVAAAMAKLADAPVHLVGHSYGGFLAMLLAASGRVPVASVAAYEPVTFGVLASKEDREGLADLARIDPDGTFFSPELEGTPLWSERFVNFWNGDGYWSKLPAWQQQAFLVPGKKMFQEVRSLSGDRTPHQAYEKLQMPALFLTGSKSPAAGRRTVEILAETMPNGRLEVIDGAGHMGPLTHADQVNAAIIAHIDVASKG